MKTADGTYVMCIFTGKICYTEREAGIVINGCKRHIYLGQGRCGKSSHGTGSSKAIPRRKYYCKECGFYHVTHKALYDVMSRTGAWEEVFYREYAKRKSRVHA